MLPGTLSLGVHLQVSAANGEAHGALHSSHLAGVPLPRAVARSHLEVAKRVRLVRAPECKPVWQSSHAVHHAAPGCTRPNAQNPHLIQVEMLE